MACGPVGDEAAAGDSETRAGSEASLAGVVLEPNTIRGRVRFTNQNPTILQLLDAEPRLWGSVTASSTAPAGYSGSFLSPKQPNMRGFDFEMSVEAGAGGASGVTYTLAPRWYPSAAFDFAHYQFQPVAGVKVLPRSVQPQPTEVDINECVGVIRFQWGQDAACTTPVSVNQVRFNGALLVNQNPVSSLNHYVRGGTSGSVELSYAVPVTDGFNRFSRFINYNLACDQVMTVCTQVPGAGSLGAFHGPWQVEGENDIHLWLLQLNGPGYRYSFRQPPFTAPASDPSTWWKLSDLPRGTYGELSTTGLVRKGRDYTYFRASAQSPQLQALANQTSALLKNGNYPFVMRPAYLEGSLRLVDPSVPRRPGAYSSLQGLFFEGDHDSNGDGAPDNIYYDPTGGRYSSILDAAVDVHRFSRTSFRGAFAPASGELASRYEHVLPVAWNDSATWSQNYLRLGFWTQGGTFVTRPGQYDPQRYRYGYLDVTQKQRTALLAPGERAQVDHEYCFNEVQVEYSTQGAPFYNPTATVTGGYQGTDWRGKAADYTASGQLWGIPAAVGLPEAEARGYAQRRGSVSFALPQGSYTLTPGATLVNSDGTTSSATFQASQVTLGCGQQVKLVPPLAVSLDTQPTCAPGASTTLSGQVRSGSVTVDRVWYRLNGGPEVTVCTNCGVDPSFQFPVALATCGNTLQVYAHSEGMPEPSVTTQELIWDDPADGPSCAGATCVTLTPLRVTLVNLRDYDHTRVTSLRLWGYVTSRTAGVRADAAWFSVNGVSIPVVPRAADGFVEATVSLQPGDNRIQLVARDSRGGLTSSPEQHVFVDHQLPTVTLLSPGDEAPIGSNAVVLRLQVEDASPTTVTTAAGFRQEVPAGGGTVAIPLTFSTRGYVTTTVTVRDDAGNVTQRPVRLWVDFVPPEVKPSVADGAAIAPIPGDTFTFTVDVGSLSATTVTLSNLPGQQFPLPRNGGRLQVSVPLQPGANTFDLRATSETGLTTTVSRTLHYSASP
jgi:hypothetical protein